MESKKETAHCIGQNIRRMIKLKDDEKYWEDIIRGIVTDCKKLGVSVVVIIDKEGDEREV